MKRIASMLGGLLLAAGCAATTTERLQLPRLETVAQVDLSRYLGTWYEIANFRTRQVAARGPAASSGLAPEPR
jgi:lipocalin